MKISVDIDLTPQEAREFIGWPDMSKIHEATLSQLNEQIKSGDQEAITSLLKPFLNGSQHAFSHYQTLLETMVASATKK